MATQKGFSGNMVIAAGFIFMFFGIGLGINCVGLFKAEAVSTMGFTDGGFSLVFTIASLSMMFASLAVGKLLTKVSARTIFAFGSVIYAVCFSSFIFCRSLVEFYAVAVAMGIGMASLTIIPVTAVINNWFVKKRGLAIGIVFAGTGLGGLVLNPLLSFVIRHNLFGMEFGWQSGYLAGGILALVFCLPAALFMVWKTPEEVGQVPDGDLTSMGANSALMERGYTLKQVLKMPVFWLAALTVVIFSIVNQGINPHIISYLSSEIGFSPAAASLIFGCYLGMTIPGKISLGLLKDKKGSVISLLLFVTIVMIGLLILVFTKSLTMAILFIVVCGFGNVIQTVLPPLITAECFGTKNYGVIFSVLTVFMTLGSGIGAPLTGFIKDATGSFQGAFYLYMVLLAVSLVSGYFVLRNAAFAKKPEVVTSSSDLLQDADPA